MGDRGDGQTKREARVLAAARELFDLNGFEATSIRQIADRAGVSVATVEDTGDKAALLERVLRDEEHAAMLGRLSSFVGDKQGTVGFVEEIDAMFNDWYQRLDGRDDLVRAYLLSVLAPMEQGQGHDNTGDEELVAAIRNRLLVRHPDLGERAGDIAYATYSSHVVAMIAVAIGSASVDEARQRANRAVTAMTAALLPQSRAYAEGHPE